MASSETDMHGAAAGTRPREGVVCAFLTSPLALNLTPTYRERGQYGNW